jgi:hypothetical protein
LKGGAAKPLEDIGEKAEMLKAEMLKGFGENAEMLKG